MGKCVQSSSHISSKYIKFHRNSSENYGVFRSSPPVQSSWPARPIWNERFKREALRYKRSGRPALPGMARQMVVVLTSVPMESKSLKIKGMIWYDDWIWCLGVVVSGLFRLEKKVYLDTDNTDTNLGVEFDPYWHDQTYSLLIQPRKKVNDLPSGSQTWQLKITSIIGGARRV